MLIETVGENSVLSVLLSGKSNSENAFSNSGKNDSGNFIQKPNRLKKYYQASYLSNEFITQSAPGPKSAELRAKYIKYLIFDLMNACGQYHFTDIPFVDKTGKKRKHSPFLKITYRTDVSPAMYWKPKIVEVWSREEIFANWDWFPNYYRAVRRYARKKGWDFLLVTDIFFESDFFANIEFLVPHLGLLPVDLEFNQRSFKLIKGLEELGEIQIKYLLEYVSEDETDRKKNELVLWNLLLGRRVKTNYLSKITLHSTVWKDLLI